MSWKKRVCKNVFCKTFGIAHKRTVDMTENQEGTDNDPDASIKEECVRSNDPVE